MYSISDNSENINKRVLITGIGLILFVIGVLLCAILLTIKFGPILGHDSVGPNIIRIISEFTRLDYAILGISISLSFIGCALILLSVVLSIKKTY